MNRQQADPPWLISVGIFCRWLSFGRCQAISSVHHAPAKTRWAAQIPVEKIPARSISESGVADVDRGMESPLAPLPAKTFFAVRMHHWRAGTGGLGLLQDGRAGYRVRFVGPTRAGALSSPRIFGTPPPGRTAALIVPAFRVGAAAPRPCQGPQAPASAIRRRAGGSPRPARTGLARRVSIGIGFPSIRVLRGPATVLGGLWLAGYYYQAPHPLQPHVPASAQKARHSLAESDFPFVLAVRPRTNPPHSSPPRTGSRPLRRMTRRAAAIRRAGKPSPQNFAPDYCISIGLLAQGAQGNCKRGDVQRSGPVVRTLAGSSA